METTYTISLVVLLYYIARLFTSRNDHDYWGDEFAVNFATSRPSWKSSNDTLFAPIKKYVSKF